MNRESNENLKIAVINKRTWTWKHRILLEVVDGGYISTHERYWLPMFSPWVDWEIIADAKDYPMMIRSAMRNWTRPYD
jgi:hypothetical protein